MTTTDTPTTTSSSTSASTSTDDRAPRRLRSSGPMLGLVLGLTGLFTLLLTAFAWPAAQLGPRELPVAVAGPAEAVAGVDRALTGAFGEDAFELHPAGSRSAVVAAIQDREVYGGLVLSPEGADMLTASAASPAVAQLLGQVASRLPTPEGTPAVTVIDVVPTAASDPRGAAFAAGSLPLVVGGIITAAAMSMRPGRRLPRALGAVAVAAGAGLAMTAVLQYWLGALAGSYWANAGVVALGLAATALFVLGLHNLVGRAGLPLGAAIVMLLGNPFSGTTSAPELLPAGWSAVGQWMPPGASGQALRSTAFFDGSAVGAPLLVLATWLVAGVALLTIRARRAPAADVVPADRRSRALAG